MVMPFLDIIDRNDWIVLEAISTLLDTDPEVLDEILAHQLLRDGITDGQVTAVPLLYLELRDPEAAAMIQVLPWIQEERRLKAVVSLQRLAVEAPEAFRIVVGKPWIQGTQDDFIWDMELPLFFISSIAQIDVEAAAKVVGLPFLDTIEIEDLMALETLRTLFEDNPTEARNLLSDQALLDGMRASPAATVALLYLKADDPEVSAAIQALSWVQDGIAPYSDIIPSKTSLEAAVVLGLLELYRHSREACLALVQSSWSYDGLDNREYTALGNLATIAHSDGEAAAQLVAMPFLETFELNDLSIIQILERLPKSDLQELLSDPALRGGITDEHVGTVALLRLGLQDPDAAAVIRSLPWVADGIVATDGPPIRLLSNVALVSQKVFGNLVQRSWVQDGLSPDEVTVVSHLRGILASSSEKMGRSGSPGNHRHALPGHGRWR